MQQGSLLSLSPSFNSYSPGRFAEIAARVIAEDSISDEITEESQNLEQQETQIEENDEEDDDFEFAFVCRDPDGSTSPADEIFSNGQIRPIFPIFNRDLIFSGGDNGDSKEVNDSSIRLPLRKLLIEERDPLSCSSSEADEFESIPPGNYCVWTPKSPQASPERCKKSNSTGSCKRWKFIDFLHRSNSDGKDTYVFLAPKTMKKDEKTEKAEKSEIPKERNNSSEGKVVGNVKAKGITGEKVSAHEILYVRNRALKQIDKRRSYLPYRQDLVGFFGKVHSHF